MTYTGSLSSRGLQRLRVFAAQRSENPSEFEGFSDARIKLGEPGSSSQPYAVATLGAPNPRSTTMAPRIPPAEESSLSDEAKKVLASLPPLNLFKVLANAPAGFRPFPELGGAISGSKIGESRSPRSQVRFATNRRTPYRVMRFVVGNRVP